MILTRFFKKNKKTLTFISFLIVFFNASFGYASNDSELDKNKEFIKNLEYLGAVLNNIKYLYVDKVDEKKIFNDAIKGMVSGLDPHSAYLEPKEQKNLLENSSGKFGGLGIVISMKDGLIEVISPIDDTPAYKAGIKAGDLIIKIDDKLVRGMTLEDGVKLMRGEPKTKIKITILRKNEKPFVVNIVRDIITITSVKGYLLEKDMGYIRISSFQEPTVDLLKKSIKTLVKENNGKLKSLILDLRNNPGGLLSSAIGVSDLFLDSSDVITYTKGRIKGSNNEFNSKPGDILDGAPIAVLINQGSASASEIVTGALQDYKRAIVIGKESYGKGSVQTVITLNNGYGLKITTALYYTPSGRSIQAKGIIPDITLKNITLKENEESLIGFTEKDLKGHLEVDKIDKNSNKNIKLDENNVTITSSQQIIESQDQDKEKQTKLTIKRLKGDYFIHEAVNLLKALMIFK